MTWQSLGEVAARVAGQADDARHQRINAIFMAGAMVGATAAFCGSRSPVTFAVLESVAKRRRDANGRYDWTSLLDQVAMPARKRRDILSTTNGVALAGRIVRARRNAAAA